ncbi:hypothetical protein HWV23_12755 [Natronomonas halophila]|uniref:hypothetical protein n=1 Tax=Natronomonas halophila TaxID=2747817 RepID=UPI0015B49569|nr:hypothetical protein [Natronomonas halophila]QLD86561.1 hypothetical protein HWV23_12755 [Natronomonas halophila]
MKRRSVLASMGAFTASGSLVIGSNGFTSAEVERDVSVDVVGDEDAFLGLLYEDFAVEEPPNDVEPTTLRSDYEERLVELLNQFGVALTVDEFEIDVETDDGVEAELSHVPDILDIGESGDVLVDIECSSVRLETETATVYFDVAVSGTGVSIETTESRDIRVECPKTTDNLIQSLRFTGAGNVRLTTASGVSTMTIDAWLLDKDDRTPYLVESQTLSGIGGNTTLQPKNLGESQDSFAAIYIGEVDKTYVHPGLQKANGRWKVTGTGSGVEKDGRLSRSDLIDILPSL